MAKLLRIIGLLVLAFALWQVAGDAFIGGTVDVERTVAEKIIKKNVTNEKAVAANAADVAYYQQENSCIATPQLPYLPDAELAGTGGQSHLLTISHLQRAFTTKYIFSLRDWIDKVAQRTAALSLHREKLYDTTAYYRCQPVCEYYIFTLRRILI